jgi:hypothetical protein
MTEYGRRIADKTENQKFTSVFCLLITFFIIGYTIKTMTTTSLIPSVVALSQFFIANFPSVSWYPYWYLGNPFYYLIGPVVPVLMAFPYKLFKLPKSFISVEYLILILIAQIFTALGIYLLLRTYKHAKNIAVITALFYFCVPFQYLALSYQNGLKLIALMFIPYFILSYKRYLKNYNLLNGVIIVILVALILLTNAASFLTVVICIITLLFSFRKTEQLEELIIKTVIIILLGLSLSTFWYKPVYWWVMLSSPSFGGVALINVALNIIKGLFQFLPLMLAILFVKWRKFKPSGYALFSFLFFISFIVLTVIRFLANPAFVIDWTGFVPEMQLGLALMIGAYYIYLAKRKVLLALVAVFIILLNCYIAILIFNNTTIQQYNNEKNAYKNKIIDMITKTVPKSERVFLSGSPVFWINSESKILQVRGSNDIVSTSQWWAHGAYQIREGKDADLASIWLRIFGASYILVNNSSSQEPFHDFKNAQKFADNKYFILADKKNGNYLYQVKDSNIARVATQALLYLSDPKNGADKKTLLSYIKTILHPAELKFIKPDLLYIRANTTDNEIISLAISYDSHWQIIRGQGILTKDNLFNIVIIPGKPGTQEFILQYKNSYLDLLIPLMISVVLFVILIKFTAVYSFWKKISPRFSIGLNENDEEY